MADRPSRFLLFGSYVFSLSPQAGRGEERIATLNPWLLVEPAAQQADVAHVGAEHDVEGIARERHHADHAVDRDIAEHARGEIPRRAQRAGLAHQPQRDRGGDDVADDRDQPDQAVDAIADIRAGQDEGDIEQLCDRLDPRHPLLPRQIAERVSLAELEAKLAKPLLQCFGTDLMAVLVDDRPARFGARKTPARAGPGTGSVRSKNVVIGHGHGLWRTHWRGGSCRAAPERRAFRSKPQPAAAPRHIYARARMKAPPARIRRGRTG